MNEYDMHRNMTDARALLFSGAPWYDTVDEESVETWAAWRIAKSSEPAWWKEALHVSALFAEELGLLPKFRARFAGVSLAELSHSRAERERRRSTDPLWDIANELIVARYLERVLGWRLAQHEPLGHSAKRGDWQFIARSGREIFVEVKSLHEPERPSTGVYSRAPQTGRIRSVLKEAYRQLPDDGRATLVVLVSPGEILRVSHGIMHGDLFQSLFGQMQISMRVMPYDSTSVRMAPSFRDTFVQGAKHRRLGLVAGMVVSGMHVPGVRWYAVRNPYAHQDCRTPSTDVEPAEQFVIDGEGHGSVHSGITPDEVWRRMSDGADGAGQRSLLRSGLNQ